MKFPRRAEVALFAGVLVVCGCGVSVSPMNDADVVEDRVDAGDGTAPETGVADARQDAMPDVQALGPLAGRVTIVGRWTEAATDDYFTIHPSFWDTRRDDIRVSQVGGCQMIRFASEVVRLSAGPLTVAWRGEHRVLTPSSENVYPPGLAVPGPREGDSVLLSGGSTTVGAFSGALVVPPVPMVLEPSGPDLPQPLPPEVVVRWLPNADPTLEVRVMFSWVDAGNNVFYLSCFAPASAGRFAAPADVMAVLRPLSRRRMKVAFSRGTVLPIGAFSLEYRVERTAGFATYE